MKLHYDAAVVDRYIDLAPGYGWGYRVGFREAPYNYFTTYQNLKDALAGGARRRPARQHPVMELPAAVERPIRSPVA